MSMPSIEVFEKSLIDIYFEGASLAKLAAAIVAGALAMHQ